MDLKKTLKKINQDRERIEASWVFSLWKDPDLFAQYPSVDSSKDNTLQTEDALFYFRLGKAMYQQGFKNFDRLAIDTFINDKPNIKKKFEDYGGFHSVEEIMSLINIENVDVYFDKLAKINSLTIMAQKCDEIFEDVDRFHDASNEDVYNTFEMLNNSVSLSTGNNERIESLVIDDKFIEQLESGENVGYNYGRYSPILNYITLGAAPGSLYMVGGHSGTGKSSFCFGNIIMGLHYSGVPSAIISNEMGINTYKILLLEHILTNDLNYWKLTRKQLKIGKFDDEQKAMIDKAMKLSKEKYADIKFVKMFDNDIGKIMKYMRKLKSHGIKVVFYDTFKSDDAAETSQLWQSLMLDARRLFQCCSKLDICCITTYQLALHTTNQRFLDASCLSNSKQIKEVYETMCYFRPLWDDEYNGEKFDVHPYRISKDNSKIKEEIQLDKNEKYLLLFVDKTRADEDKQVLIYQWKARFNQWKELGFARVINEHRSY